MAAMIGLFIRKLEQFGTLSHEERQVIENLPINVRQVAANHDIAREGQRSDACMLLLSGMVCRYRLLQNGQRQIMSFHFPGDILDLTSLLLGNMDHNIGALTPIEVAPIAHATLLDWTERYPRLGRLLWQDTLVDAAVFREWVVNVGRRSVYARTAHLLCEMVTRLSAVGLVHDDVCDLPITPAELADATGLSIVHVNRALQELRSKQLVDLRDTALVLLNWEGLQQAGGFNPGYLHQRVLSTAA